jgi:hypothetical protein
MLEMLIAMGVEELKAKYCLIQIKNKGIAEVLDYMDRLSNKVDIQAEMAKYQNSLNAVATKKKKKPKYIPLELQRLFSELQLINRETVSTEGCPCFSCPSCFSSLVDFLFFRLVFCRLSIFFLSSFPPPA